MNTGIAGHLLTIFAFGVLTNGLYAQAGAPDFLCTRSEAGGEVLSWENTNPDCGPPTGTVIFRATSFEGPYEVLDTIEDPGIGEYRDENPSGQQLFYYLEQLNSCEDELPSLSDTLDNFIPETPTLRFISVEEEDLLLVWEPSASPEVSGYVIFEVTTGGVIAIDTVGLVDRYLVEDVPTEELTGRRYRIAAIDPCGNDSPQGRIVSATGLTGTGGIGCDVEIDISSIPSDESSILGTPDGAPVLFASVEGASYTTVDYTLLPPATYRYALGNDGETICFYLQQGILESEDSVRTDTFCTTLDIDQPVRPFDLYGVQVEDDGSFTISYDSRSLQPGVTTSSVTVAGGVVSEEYPVPGNIFDRDRLSIPAEDPLQPGDSVFVTVTDGCDRAVLTEIAQPVFLNTGVGIGGGPTLEWSPLVNGAEGTTTYEIIREDTSGTTEVIASVAGEVTTFVDEGQEEGCYRIRAIFSPTDADTAYIFLSNLSCVVLDRAVYLPNVFSPGASQPENQTFGPFFDGLPAISEYSLRVFDRWGALVFESEDPARGWDGELGGRMAPTAAYVYVLRLRQAGGNLIQQTGVVTLLR